MVLTDHHFVSQNATSQTERRTNVNSASSSYNNTKYGVPQGSIFAPILFDIYIFDLFLSGYKCDIKNFFWNKVALDV